MDYFREVSSQSFWDAWNLVFERSVPTAVIGLGIFGATLFLLKLRRKHEEAKLRAREFLEAAGVTAVCFVIFWVLYFGFFTPKRLLMEARRKTMPLPAGQAAAQPPPIKLDIMDTESRKEIQKLRKELATANETIDRQQSQLDPLAKPIASAKFTLAINFKDKKEAQSNYFGSGAAALLAVGTQVILGGGVAEHNSDGQGHSRVVFDCPFDVVSMGKPVRSLSEAQFLELQFADGFVPVDTELSEGKVVLLINNEITLTFEVPAQKVTQKLEGGTQQGTLIRITDIQKALAPLTTLPSPTPDKGVSPP